MVGTLIGIFIIGVIANGLNLLGVGPGPAAHGQGPDHRRGRHHRRAAPPRRRVRPLSGRLQARNASRPKGAGGVFAWGKAKRLPPRLSGKEALCARRSPPHGVVGEGRRVVRARAAGDAAGERVAIEREVDGQCCPRRCSGRQSPRRRCSPRGWRLRRRRRSSGWSGFRRWTFPRWRCPPCPSPPATRRWPPAPRRRPPLPRRDR